MTKMKRYPRFLALLATLALLLNSVPLILQAAADNAAMTLRVLEDFTGLVPGGEVGSLTVDGVNKGTVAAAESPCPGRQRSGHAQRRRRRLDRHRGLGRLYDEFRAGNDVGWGRCAAAVCQGTDGGRR